MKLHSSVDQNVLMKKMQTHRGRDAERARARARARESERERESARTRKSCEAREAGKYSGKSGWRRITDRRGVEREREREREQSQLRHGSTAAENWSRCKLDTPGSVIRVEYSPA